jgi:ADP-ribosylation factor family
MALPNAEKSPLNGATFNVGFGLERKWLVQGCSVVRGEGIFEGLDWLASVITRKNMYY